MEKKKDEFVIDSSVVAKWFLIEHDSNLAFEVRDEFATYRLKLAVPTLLFYEVMNALRFSGTFNEEDLAVAARSLSKYQFEIWRPVGKLLELTAQIALKETLTVYDACYVALAQRKSSRVITEDKELLGKFPALTLALGKFNKAATRSE